MTSLSEQEKYFINCVCMVSIFMLIFGVQILQLDCSIRCTRHGDVRSLSSVCNQMIFNNIQLWSKYIRKLWIQLTTLRTFMKDNNIID